MADRQREVKILPSQTMAFDPETGVVEAYVSVMGILDDDDPPDLIEPGAFGKSIMERGPGGANRIRTLWQHDWKEVIGRPVALAEHPRDMLPEKLLERWPQATGGLYAKTQFVVDVQRGREALALYKAGAMDEWSIGFDTITSQWEKMDERSYRRIKEIRLWEYSPVTWGANPATVTTSVKNNGQPGLSEQVKALAELMGLADGLDEAEVLVEVERRLRGEEPHPLAPSPKSARTADFREGESRGAEPRERALTPREVAQLKARLMQINLRLAADEAGRN